MPEILPEKLAWEGVEVEAGGGAFIADLGNHCIRHIDAERLVTTISGHIGVAGHRDTASGDKSEEDELSITSALASDVNYFQKHLDRANFEAHPKFCIHQRGVPPNLGLSVLGCIDAQFLQNLAALKKSRNNRTEKRISPQKMQVFEPQSWPSLLERERYSS